MEGNENYVTEEEAFSPDFTLKRNRFPVVALNLGELTKKQRGKIVCGLCRNWHKGNVTYIKVGEKDVSQRQCILDGKKKLEHEPACNEFILADYFYCQEQNQYIHVRACVKRQNERVSGCSKSCSHHGHVIRLLLGS